MRHTEDFENYVNECSNNNTYVGIGNPYSKILIIGKEEAKKENDKKDGCVNDWQKHLHNNDCQILEYEVKPDNPLYKTWGINTWSKYQYLIDRVRNKKSDSHHVDFLKDVFTTEINDSPSKRTTDANKDSIPSRIELFKKSNFIKLFPVVIIACSNYIKNTDGNRQIDDTFDVTYDGDILGRHEYNKSNWFYTHHSSDGKRLVIHTRQLSGSLKNEMLDEIANKIREHLKKNNL